MKNSGKHSERKKNSIGKVIRNLFILIVLGIVIWVMYFLYNEIMDNRDIESTENGPVISYYDDKTKLKVPLKDNDVFNRNIELSFNKGSAKVSKDGGKYNEYEGETLTSGNYVIKVEAKDKTATTMSFKIDTKLPTIDGVKDGGEYTKAKTITLNLDELKVATLTVNDKDKVINLKEELGESGIKTYDITENGKYVLYVENHQGNSDVAQFVIEKKEN